MAEEAVEVAAKVVAEVVEEIVITNHGQDRYRTRISDPLHRSLKGTLPVGRISDKNNITQKMT